MSGPVPFVFSSLFWYPRVLRVSSPEIVSWREANKGKTTVESPKLDDPAFRALVEENVKDSVFNVITSPVMRQHWTAYIAQNSTSSSRQRRAAPSNTPLKPVYVHGE